jgi:hypothetical protein
MPSEHVPNHAGDLSRATGHLRAAVAKWRGRPPAAPFFLQVEKIYYTSTLLQIHRVVEVPVTEIPDRIFILR